ncbi:MAG: alpha/beta hydrolase [Hyphomicrobium sp.]
MKIAEADILIVPGWSSSGPDHWQSRWEKNIRTARRIQQQDWYRPNKNAWVARLVEEVAQSVRPVVLVAHSLGVITVAHAAAKLARLPGNAVAGAFLVAPADVESAAGWPVTDGWTFENDPQRAHHQGGDGGGFAPIPMTPLPFPSALVASSTDPYCSRDRAALMADAWGSALIESGDVGHINVASGHGPWPDGLLTFGMFMQRL